MTEEERIIQEIEIILRRLNREHLRFLYSLLLGLTREDEKEKAGA